MQSLKHQTESCLICKADHLEIPFLVSGQMKSLLPHRRFPYDSPTPIFRGPTGGSDSTTGDHQHPFWTSEPSVVWCLSFVIIILQRGSSSVGVSMPCPGNQIQRYAIQTQRIQNQILESGNINPGLFFSVIHNGPPFKICSIVHSPRRLISSLCLGLYQNYLLLIVAQNCTLRYPTIGKKSRIFSSIWKRIGIPVPW